MKKKYKYWNDLAKFFSGEMEETETIHFLKKVKYDQQLREDFDLIENTWDHFGKKNSDHYYNTNKAWQNLKNRIEENGILHDTSTQSKRYKFRHNYRVAALILLMFAVGIPTIYFSVKEFTSSRYYIERTTEESQKTYELPDGSRVFLNEGASLNFNNKNFDDQREVSLKGEGYFEIMADRAKPFHVNTGKVVITVLGTSFNVKEAENKNVEVFVESGQVRVTLKKSEESIILEAGELALANEKLITTSLTDLNYLSWKTKEFQFIDRPLSEILQILESAYHVNVNTDNIPVSEMHLTTTYKGQTFEAILSTICAAFNINYQKEGKVYILHEK